MEVIETKLKGCYIIIPTVYQDHRGYFVETYNSKKYKEIGIDAEFVQDNQSLSSEKGTIRGLHLQNNPMAQAKLVRCTQGSVFDVAVDLRPNSSTYKEWVGVVLSAENQYQFYIPKGFAHGFQTLSNDVIFQYKVDDYFSKEHERSIVYNDPEIDIQWPIEYPILSDKDKNAPVLKRVDLG